MSRWTIFLDQPWLALVPAHVFLFAWLVRFAREGSSRLVRFAAGLPVAAWTAYAIYEWRMKAWSSTVVAPIRIDLFLVIPVLVAVSFIGLVALARRRAAA